MTTSLIQTAFSAGEIAPALYGHVDLAKYHVAGTTVRNCTVNYRGGLDSRGGTAYVLRSLTKPAPGVQPPRVITFQFSVNQGITLELGDQYMRFFINGAPVTTPPVNISYIGQTDPVTVSAPGGSFPDPATWVTIAGVNGMTPLNGRTFLSYLIGGLLQLTNLDGTFVDATQYPPYVSGGTIASIYEITTPWAGADIAALKFTESTDVMSFTHPSYPPYDLSRITDNDWTLTEVTFTENVTPPQIVNVAATTQPNPDLTPPTLPAAYAYVVTSVDADGNESIASPIGNVTNGVDMAVTAGSNGVYWGQNGIGGVRFNIYRAPTSYNTGGSTTEAEPVPAGAIFSYVGSSTGNQFIDSNIIPDTSQSPPSHNDPFSPGQITEVVIDNSGGGYSTVTLSVSTLTGAGENLVPVIIGGQLVAITVVDGGANFAPGDSLVITGDGTGASGHLILGPSTGTWPSVVAYFQQRRVYASTENNPDTYYMSRPGAYLDFDVSFPSSSNDAITGTPWAQQVNGIQWMVQMPGGLVTFCGKGAWNVAGAGSSGIYGQQPITPSSQQATPVIFNGCSPLVPPIQINYELLYVQTMGVKVYDATYNIFTGNYTGSDVTALSSHLLGNYDISQWAWAEEPNKIIWALRCDGVLLSFTFVKEQEVYGWARHDTNGQFVSVTAVTEPPVDALYCVVERLTLYGPAYFIERMDDRQWQTNEDPWCVDCGLQYPQYSPGIDIVADTTEGSVNFIAAAPAFPASSVGSVLRVAGGIANITGMTDSQHINGVWVVSPTQVIPS